MKRPLILLVLLLWRLLVTRRWSILWFTIDIVAIVDPLIYSKLRHPINSVIILWVSYYRLTVCNHDIDNSINKLKLQQSICK